MTVRTALIEHRLQDRTGDVVVEATDLSYSYAAADGERVALHRVSLAVPPGAIFGLLGPNGSGKSTFLSLAAGLRRPTSGAIRVFGAPPGPETRRRVGVLFQEQCLDPLMTARETLWLHGRLYGMPRHRLRERVRAALDSVGLGDRAHDPTRALSGGMRRRLELARALLPEPTLLLLDEPTTGLDPDSKQQLWERLVEASRNGLTILLATNDVAEAERYCDAVAFFSEGRL
ncbi:MAG TPA: ABC transporter ATP-binding protein, partial [Dehalococcoidia bacterium]|nr:ABC transporter ATP-binding protein [Dehalococcoidia bacterium]